MTDARPVGVGEIEQLQHRDRVADVARPLLGIERAVGGEQHAVGAVELEAADGRRARAEHRAVGIEILEVVKRALLQALQHRPQVLVRGARAELVPAGPDPALEVRHHGAEVVHHDLEVRQAVEQAREHQARHRSAGLVGPAEGPPDLVLGLFLGQVVREADAARRVQQDRHAERRGRLEHRQEFRRVERLAVDVAADLHAVGAVVAHRPLELARGVRVVHRERRGMADEAVGMARDQLGEPVIGEPRELRRLGRRRQRLDRRLAERDDLRVVVELVHHPEAQVEVVDAGDLAHALADARKAGLAQRLEVARREEVVVGVDVAHFPLPRLGRRRHRPAPM